MRRFVACVRRVFADPLFFRVCMVYWAVPFLALWIPVSAMWPPSEPLAWIGVASLGAIALGAGCLVYLAVHGSEEAIDRASAAMADGGDWIGIAFVAVIVLLAFPTTLLLRAAVSRRRPR